MKGKLIKKIACVAASVVMAAGMAPLMGGAEILAAEHAAPVFQFAENGGGSYTDAYQHVAFTEDGGFVVGGYTFGESETPEWSYAAEKHNYNNGVIVK